jgi:hypothetical protein
MEGDCFLYFVLGLNVEVIRLAISSSTILAQSAGVGQPGAQQPEGAEAQNLANDPFRSVPP